MLFDNISLYHLKIMYYNSIIIICHAASYIYIKNEREGEIERRSSCHNVPFVMVSNNPHKLVLFLIFIRHRRVFNNTQTVS